MVDFSSIFILFAYVQELLALLNINVDEIWQLYAGIFCILALISLVIGLFKKNRSDANHYNMKRFFLLSAAGLFSAAAIVSLAALWPNIAQSITQQTGIDATLISRLVFIVIGCVVLAILLYKGIHADNEPNNDSRLNRHQYLLAWTFVVALIVVSFIVYTINSLIFTGVVSVIMFAVELVSILFWFYDPILYILSRIITVKPKTTCPPTPSKLNRFAVLGCAHNEEEVIGQLVESLHGTIYPKNSYDIYVICDNCTDGTADVVREAGAIAMERHDTEHRGKGYALQWMFDYLSDQREKGNEYDAYIVLDADNLVNESFFDEINYKMNEGYEILQAYLGCKNPTDTWVSRCYSYAYWVSDEMFQAAHSRLGLTAQMGGTGMVLRPKVLDEIGWHTDSLTEDLVLTSRYVLEKNLSCCWVEGAKLYDEKPLRVKPSIKQRTRWMQGHMDAFFRFGGKLFSASIKNVSFKQFDMAFYLARPLINLILACLYLIRLSFNIIAPDLPLASPFIMDATTSTLLVLGIVLLQSYMLFNEYYSRYVHWYFLQLVFAFSWYPAIFRGLIKRNEKFWLSTVHTRNLSIGDIRENDQIQEARERLRGLDNVHRLPLGQILVKAAVITSSQLEEALDIQKKKGGFLGDIIVETRAVSPEVLDAYLSIQQEMRDMAQGRDSERPHVRLGELLVESGLITQGQVNVALEYQKEHGCLFGEALIATRSMPIDLLSAFLSVQKILDANYVSPDSARHLMKGLMRTRHENLGTILYEGGLVSAQQLNMALERQKEKGGPIGENLIDLGFLSPETLDTILELQSNGRAYISEKTESDLYLDMEGGDGA